MIEIIGLSKRFKDIIAVNNVNLTINDGEIFGLLGPNGAGKSTLIHLLATIIKPTSGTAKVDGYDIIKDGYQVRKLIGVSFQDAKLDWQLSIIETLRWHGNIWRIEKNELNERIDEYIKTLNLKEYKTKKNWKLSGGTRKKVEVIKTLIARPKIAIFDEPTAFLDPMMKKIIWNYIKEMRDQGSTIILATNLMQEADILSDRVAIMDRGNVIVIDSPMNLKCSIPGGDILLINVDKNNISIENDRIKADLEAVSEIVEVNIKSSIVNNNEIEIKILLNQAKKIASEILNYFQSKNLIIRNFEMKNPTLDDIFFYYTKSSL
ncbi:MAG: ATP-binding cassette domain-containing protein [Candidatus Helarchaeota archaeon]